MNMFSKKYDLSIYKKTDKKKIVANPGQNKSLKFKLKLNKNKTEKMKTLRYKKSL